MKYICNPCNYETNDFSNYSKHKSTRKHKFKCISANNISIESKQSQPIININQPIISTNQNNKTIELDGKLSCPNCRKLFSYKQSLSRHKKTCKENVPTIKDLQNEVEKLKTQLLISSLQAEIKNKDTKIELLTKNNATLATVAENNSETSKTSCSALSFILKNYKSAPCIKPFDKFELLLEGNDDYSVAEVVIHKYKRKELQSYIGDILIKQYKKENPGDQSMWTTDAARLAWMIRELTADDEEEWYTDKGGVKTSKYTTKPILEHIKEDLLRYINEAKELLLDEELSQDKQTELRHNTIDGFNVLQIIANNELGKSIIKYISTFFHLDRKPITKDLPLLEEK
jgi:hypothetical protein